MASTSSCEPNVPLVGLANATNPMATEKAQDCVQAQSMLNYYDDGLVCEHARDIRLLKLRLHDGKLQSYLRVVSLDESPVYKAVSYTWGPATRDDVRQVERASEIKQRSSSITCNDRSLEVTQNLYDCLLQLARMYPSSPKSGTEFWIDAVCINQHDLDERCLHVSMMSDIFHQAEEVAIWLGLSDNSTPLARQLIHRLGSMWIDESPHLRKEFPDDRKQIDFIGTLLNVLEMDIAETNIAADSRIREFHSRAHWESVLTFFSRTWFVRSWVVQELVLARKTIVLCGDMVLDWAHIAAVSDFLATRVSRKKLRSWVGEDFDIEKATYKSPAKLEAVKRDLQDKHSSILLRSLMRCRDYGCKEDKDKIFSLLGIYQLATQTQLCPKDKLYPNYGLGTAEVYTSAAVQILERDTDLTLLTMAEGEDFRGPQRAPDLPSWVPDWSFGTWKTSIGLGITGYKRFSAGSTLQREIAFSDDNKILFVKAAKLDTINRVGETKEEVENDKSFDRWLDILESAELRYSNSEGRLEAFWRTLVTDTDELGRTPARASLEAGFLQWMTRKMRNLTGEASRRRERIIGLDDTLQSKLTGENRGNLAAEYELQFSHALHQRPLLTSQGYLGLGSQSMKIDFCEREEFEYSIWLVCGLRVPLVLRSTSRKGRYNLVGGAYVHGIMQGEALQRDLQFETIGLE